MHIAIETNEKKKKKKTKNKYFLKKGRCQLSLLWKTNFTVFIDFQEFYILLFIYSLDQAKNVFHVTESWY